MLSRRYDALESGGCVGRFRLLGRLVRRPKLAGHYAELPSWQVPRYAKLFVAVGKCGCATAIYAAIYDAVDSHGSSNYRQFRHDSPKDRANQSAKSNSRGFILPVVDKFVGVKHC